MAAAEAVSNGDYAKAIECFTTAIKLMPSPLVYAKRADCYLKLKKPVAAQRDCDKALASNPDSAKALRVRGTAQRIHYDDSIDDIQKFVNKRCADRNARLGKKKAKEAEKAKAGQEYEAQKAQEAASSGGGGMPGGMPGMGGMG